MRTQQLLKLVLGACVSATPGLGLGQQTPQQASQVIEEIVVTGTYIRRQSQLDSPSPLITVGFEDIDDLGVNEISDVIERMTINTGSQNSPDAFTQNFTTGTTNINLRGLGVSSTLVMLNSRRQVQSAIATNRGNNFVDTSALPPMIAFDRIETLKDGATALYGSDAVAGVVNFITRSDFEGFNLQLDMQTVDGHPQEDRQISGLYGAGNDRTHFLGAFSFLDRSPLSTNDRRLSGPTDDLSSVGSPGTFLLPSLPGNPAFAPVWTAAYDSNFNGIADAFEPLRGLDPVPGAQLPAFADQDCVTVAAQDPKVVPGIVQSVPSPGGDIGLGSCQFDFGGFWHLVPDEQRTSAYLELTHAFSDRLDGRLEAHWAENQVARNNSPSFPKTEATPVSVNHPDNPYGADVRWVGRMIGGGGTAVTSIHDSETWRLAGSLTGDLNDRWGWDAGVQLSENEFFVAVEDTLIDRLRPALLGLGGPNCDASTGTPGVGDCQYFNPFGSALTGTGTRNSPALVDWIQGTLSYVAKSELVTVDGVVTGEIGELPGGPLGIAIGAQLRDEELDYDYNDQANADNFMFLVGNPDFVNSRDVRAAFLELALPVADTLDVQLAARIEDYGGGVDSTDPKATFLWRPNLSFSLRGSLGTSFRAPSLFQAFGTQTALEELTDPLNPAVTQFFPVRTQPNPSGDPLQPEEADVANLGFSWAITDEVELGLDYWSFDYTNVIIQQNPQALLDAAAAGDPAAALQIERDVTGALLRVNSFYDNASSLDTDGFDFSLRYTRDTGAGLFSVGAETTFVSSYDLVDPQAGAIDGAGKRNFANFATSVPELRANLYFEWSRDNHGVNVYVNHIDSYLDDEGGPGAFVSIGSHTTLDAQYNVTFERDVGITFSVGGFNLTDQRPPRVSTNLGFDSKVHDPRGRMLYAKLAMAF